MYVNIVGLIHMTTPSLSWEIINIGYYLNPLPFRNGAFWINFVYEINIYIKFVIGLLAYIPYEINIHIKFVMGLLAYIGLPNFSSLKICSALIVKTLKKIG